MGIIFISNKKMNFWIFLSQILAICAHSGDPMETQWLLDNHIKAPIRPEIRPKTELQWNEKIDFIKRHQESGTSQFGKKTHQKLLVKIPGCMSHESDCTNSFRYKIKCPVNWKKQ